MTWNPDWAVKVRLKSTASTMLGEEGMGGGAAPRSGSRGADSGSAPQEGSQQSAPAADPVQEGLKALKGLFGR